MKHKSIVLYHISSEIHFRNFLIISKNLEKNNFVILYENNSGFFNKIKPSYKNKYKFINLNKNALNKLNYIKNIKLLYVSTAQPRNNFLNIIIWSLVKKIPIISIMETNQFLLHSGRINNYILPLNKLFLPTYYEKKELIKLNYNSKNLKVLGWPFFDNKNKFINLSSKYNIKNNKKNLIIIFDASSKHNPTNNFSYDDFIKIIYYFKNKLLNDYNIFIKFHPLDENNLNLMFRYFLIRNIFIIKNTDIQKCIPFFNLAITTGFSQSIIELINNNNGFVIFQIKKNKINNNFKKIIMTKENFNIRNLYKLSKKSFLFKKNQDFIYKKHTDSNKKICTEINKIIHSKKNMYDQNFIREILIWSLYFNNGLSNKKITSLLDIKNNINIALINIINENQNINDYKTIYKWAKNKIVFYPFINLYILYLIKNSLFEKNYYRLYFKIIPIDIYSIRIYFQNIKIFYKYLKSSFFNESISFKKELFINNNILIDNNSLTKKILIKHGDFLY